MMTMTRKTLPCIAVLAAVAVSPPQAAAHGGKPKPKPVACADLTKLRLKDTTIELAQLLPAGANPAPVGTIAAAVCRLVGVTKPAVRFEVWLPTDTWNDKFQLVGNGGTAGVISYAAMRTGLARGYAV